MRVGETLRGPDRAAGEKAAGRGGPGGGESGPDVPPPPSHRAPHVKPILLAYGAAEPLVLEPRPGAGAVEVRGPDGVRGSEARMHAGAALDAPARVPPLEAHVVPGDRVAIALSGPVPCAGEVVAAVRERLERAGVEAADTVVLTAPPVAGLAGQPRGEPPAGGILFDPRLETESSYVAADAEGEALHVARRLVDADAVVAIGTFSFDAALGGPALDGDLWPAFTRAPARDGVVRQLARSGRKALDGLRRHAMEAAWHMGVMASVRVVPGRGDTLHAVVFDTPAGAARAARRRAQAWRPVLPRGADVVVAAPADPHGGWAALLRAVAVAAAAVRPGGTICLAGRLAEAPGEVTRRSRQGVPLPGLVREALRSGDAALVADAFVARFLARVLGDRRLVLLSDLPGEDVEELGFGHAATPEAIERLAHRAGELVVIPDADRMLPRHG